MYPEVLNVFKIMIDFVWNVISYNIYIGNGFSISIFSIIAFVFIVTTVLSVFTLEIPRFSIGWDKYGKFSTARTNTIKKGK